MVVSCWTLTRHAASQTEVPFRVTQAKEAVNAQPASLAREGDGGPHIIGVECLVDAVPSRCKDTA